MTNGFDLRIICHTKDGVIDSAARCPFHLPDEDQLHRVDGPARIRQYQGETTESWYLNGKRHRVGGPAAYAPGYEEWWVNGKLHRLDGPAATRSGQIKEWWIDGKLQKLIASDGEVVHFRQRVTYRDHDDIEYLIYGDEDDLDFFSRYLLASKFLHRVDGPAVEHPNGSQLWFRDGLLDRQDGPAYVAADGYQEYRIHGELHRDPTEGPAVVFPDGREEFWVKGVQVPLKRSSTTTVMG